MTTVGNIFINDGVEDLEEFVSHSEKPKCQKCNGSGCIAFDGDAMDCDACDGNGYVVE